jgi:hypothetical protein
MLLQLSQFAKTGEFEGHKDAILDVDVYFCLIYLELIR